MTVLALHRLRVPPLAAFLVAGALMGPHGLALVRDEASVEALAEVGVVILLFTVGVEMSPSRLLRSGAALLLAGAVQMALTTAGVASAGTLLGAPGARAVVVGLLVAASSTTLVLRSLGERGELDAPHGRVATAILLFQDLCVVPILVLLPALGGAGDGAVGDALAGLGRAVLVVVGTFALARLVVPRVFDAVVATRSRELFALTVVFLCVGTAFLAKAAGVPLALGAFLGGLVVSESPYAHQALGELQPIRDGLSGLFFIGVGMLLDAGFAWANAPALAAIVLGIVSWKVAATGAAVWVAGYGLRVAALVGLGLAQVGEFSFVVAREAAQRGVLDPHTSQLLLSAAVLTMIVTPLLHAVAPRVADLVDRPGRTRGAGGGEAAEPGPGHVVIVGYGLCGQNVALSLRENAIPYSVVEMNPETVRRERAKGTPIRYGDAGHPAVLQAAGLGHATALVVAISDAAATRRVVAAAKGLRPDVHAVVRTRYVREVEALRALGADEVVPEELETSVEVASRVLRRYRLPREVVERVALALRADGYEAVRSPDPRSRFRDALADAALHVEVETHEVSPGAPVEGRTIGSLALRRRHGVTVVAVRHGGAVVANPDADTRLDAGDVVVLLGRRERLGPARDLFLSPARAGGQPHA